MSEFNRAQTLHGRNICRSTAAVEWLKKHRPKTALHPSMTDYCDTCKNLKEQLLRNQAILNRAHQSGSSSEGDIRALERRKEELDDELSAHREAARKSRDQYNEITKKTCKDWKEIMRLSSSRALTPSDKIKLATLKHSFTLTISADYQQSKLVPYWGRTEQPGSTYYLQKVSHDIFGIVDHSQGKDTIYLFDERIGPKNTDHTLSFLSDYWSKFSAAYPWVRRLAIYLDNATSTNKNRYLFSWAMEMVNTRRIDHIHISFMVAGHTKFAPDRLFSITGGAYKAADVFNIEDLKQICQQGAVTFIMEGDGVYAFRELLGAKYSALPGVRKLHDFLIVRTHDNRVVMKVRERTYTGMWVDSPLHVIDDALSGIPTTTYNTHTLSKEKLANLTVMYDKFIPPQFRPDYLPSPPSTSR